MTQASNEIPPIAAMSPGFPVDDFAMVAGESLKQVSVHIFRTPLQADGSHDFQYEHIRCRPDQVFATGSTVFVRLDHEEKIFHLSSDLGPCQIDLSNDVPYGNPLEIADFVSEQLAELKKDTRRKGIPRLVLRICEQPETLVDPRSLVIHQEGLFRIGHGWLVRWDEISDVSAPSAEGAAPDLRIYTTEGRLVGIRIDLL